MKKATLLVLGIAASALAQRTVFSTPLGNDTFRLKVDACLWTRFSLQNTTWHLPRLEQAESTWIRTDYGFPRPFGFVGATAQLSKHAYLRYCQDLSEINGKPSYDAFAGVTLGIADIRLGQLKLPLGPEVICAPWKTDFIDYAQFAAYRTPTGATRDIGVLHSLNHKYFQFAFGVTNGNGRNMAGDNNNLLDFSGRLAAMPLGKPSLVLGGSAYYGNDTAAARDHHRRFQRYAGEFQWNRPNYFLRGEYLYGADTLGRDTVINPGQPDSLVVPTRRTVNGFYAAAGFRSGMWQPVIRYEQFSLNDRPLRNLTFGVNAFLFNDMLKPMLNVSLIQDERDLKTTSESWKVSLQMQAAFW